MNSLEEAINRLISLKCSEEVRILKFVPLKKNAKNSLHRLRTKKNRNCRYR